MRALIKTISVLFLALIAAPSALPAMAAPAAITVTDAWVRPPAVAGRPAALYFTISNSGPADELTAAATPAAARAELHQHVHDNGIMRMKKVETVTVPAGGSVKFVPMSYHVMLFTPAPTLTPGQTIPVTLTFKAAGQIEVQAEIRTIAGTSANPDAAKNHDPHQHHNH